MSRTKKKLRRELHDSLSEISAVKTDSDTWFLKEAKRLRRELAKLKSNSDCKVQFDAYDGIDCSDVDPVTLSYLSTSKGAAAL